MGGEAGEDNAALCTLIWWIGAWLKRSVVTLDWSGLFEFVFLRCWLGFPRDWSYD